VHYVDTASGNNSGGDSDVVTVIQLCALNATASVPAETDITGDTATIDASISITSGSPCTVTWTVSVVGNDTPGGVDCIVNSGGAGGGGPAATPVNSIHSFSVTVPAGSHECGFTVCVDAVAVGTHQSGADTDCANGVLESDVLVVKYLLLIGPAAVNLSDTNGRYMWVITEIGNLASDDELVHLQLTISGALPSGCTSDIDLILPGALQFLLFSDEQKTIVWRVRYECHTPATAQVVNQTVTVGVTHCEPGTSNPNPIVNPTPGGPCDPNSINEGPGDVETFVSNNTKTTVKPVIIQ
jgi:hypothetical protein